MARCRISKLGVVSTEGVLHELAEGVFLWKTIHFYCSLDGKVQVIRAGCCFNRVCSITACEKVASDLGLGGGFPQVLWFPPPVTTGKHDFAKICQKK